MLHPHNRTAPEHASRLRPSGEDHAKRVQGGLLGDAVATFFAALGTTPPNTTLSQNNGIVGTYAMMNVQHCTICQVVSCALLTLACFSHQLQPLQDVPRRLLDTPVASGC